MTTLTGTYASGYSVAVGVTQLNVNATAKIGGSGLSDAAYLQLDNFGAITGITVTWCN